MQADFHLRGEPILYRAKQELDCCFDRKDFHAAHLEARPVLARLAEDESALFEIFTNSLLNSKFLEQVRINPVVALPIFETKAYTLVANVWIPRPDTRTDLSHQSIHHHGNLLLTSVNAFGPGYESAIFQDQYQVNPFSQEASLKIVQVFQHTKGNMEFVGPGAPHVVFYPAKLSITYALWSKEGASLGQSVVRHPLLQALKPRFRKLKAAFGGRLGLNQSGNFDFYVDDGRAYLMRDRVMYSPGTNRNFLQALHFIASEIGYRDERGLSLLSAKFPLVAAPRNEFENSHLFLPRVNLIRSEVLRCAK